MPGFEIHEDRVVSYDEHGQRTRTVHGYVKLDESVEPLLRRLRGAPLSFFICISAHEPSVCQSGKAPYTRSDIGRITGFSERALVYASQLLLSLNFVVVCGTTATGEKMYRPSETYAWFGNERGANFAEQETTEETVAQQGVQKTTRRGAKNDAAHSRSRSRGVQKTTHDDDEYTNPETLENKHHHHNMASVREILRGGGFRGRRLDEMAGLVTEEEARACVDWIARALQAPDQYRAPFGYVYTLAKTHSIAALPPIQPKRQKRLYSDEYAKYVHGAPEHTQYCREHPEEVRCECGTLTFEDDPENSGE